MPAATPWRIAFACFFGFVALWSLGFFHTSAMDSLDTPFSIEIDGTPIAKVEDNAEDLTQAKLGKDAAVFDFKDSKLHCGDWVLGRNLTEDRSLLPKKIRWFKANGDKEPNVQPVTLKKDGDSYGISFSNAALMVEENNVLADLLGDATSKVKVVLKEQ